MLSSHSVYLVQYFGYFSFVLLAFVGLTISLFFSQGKETIIEGGHSVTLYFAMK